MHLKRAFENGVQSCRRLSGDNTQIAALTRLKALEVLDTPLMSDHPADA